MDGALTHLPTSESHVTSSGAGFRVPGALPDGKFTRQTITPIRRWTDHLFSFRITRDRAYRDTIEAIRTSEVFGEELAANPGKLVYVPVVTRETPDRELGARIPALLSRCALEARAGAKLDPERSRIMICGNPDRVDDIRKHLTHAGYAVSRRGVPALMAVENYR